MNSKKFLLQLLCALVIFGLSCGVAHGLYHIDDKISAGIGIVFTILIMVLVNGIIRDYEKFKRSRLS